MCRIEDDRCCSLFSVIQSALAFKFAASVLMEKSRCRPTLPGDLRKKKNSKSVFMRKQPDRQKQEHKLPVDVRDSETSVPKLSIIIHYVLTEPLTQRRQRWRIFVVGFERDLYVSYSDSVGSVDFERPFE